MNMQNLMAQAQKMQREIMQKKEEINNKVFTGTSELVDVEVNGKKELLKVNIKNKESISVEDLEILEDMITIACNNAFSEVDKAMEDAMGAYGGALNGLI